MELRGTLVVEGSDDLPSDDEVVDDAVFSLEEHDVRLVIDRESFTSATAYKSVLRINLGQLTIEVADAEEELGEEPDEPKLTIRYEPATGSDGPFTFVDEQLGSTSARVNVASGWLNVRALDATVDAATPRIDVERFYNSTSTRDYPLGRGWRLGAQSRLGVMGNRDVSIEMPSGTHMTFRKIDDQTYRPSDRGGDTTTLTKSPTGYALELGERAERRHYDTDGRLSRRETLDASKIVTYGHDGQGRVNTVTDALQRVTRIEGDSGGPGFKNGTGYGIIVAKDQNRPCDVYYQGVVDAARDPEFGFVYYTEPR